MFVPRSHLQEEGPNPLLEHLAPLTIKPPNVRFQIAAVTIFHDNVQKTVLDEGAVPLYDIRTLKFAHQLGLLKRMFALRLLHRGELYLFAYQNLNVVSMPPPHLVHDAVGSMANFFNKFIFLYACHGCR